MIEDGEEPGAAAPLTRDVQEYLGRKLRTSLTIDAEKPAFLGDPALPPQFAAPIRKLQVRERNLRSGYEAVRNALGVSEDDIPPDDAAG